MNIIDKFLIKSTKSGSLRDVKLALSLHNIKNSFEKFFSKINPFRDRASFNVSGDQTLTQALEYAVTNLDHNVMKLLTDAGANVNAIGSDSIGSVIYKYDRALAHEKEVMPILGKEYFKDYKEKCCLMLGELVANGVMPQNAAEKEKILDIFKETDGFNEFKEVAKLKFETNSVSNMIPPKKSPRTFEYEPTTIHTEVRNNVIPPKKPPRTFEYKPQNDALLSKEPIYSKVSNLLEELSVSEESIYAEIYDSYKRSNENLSLEDSDYSSISEEPICEDVGNFSEQKKSANLNHKEQQEPIYAKVDLFKKRAERKAKDIKANSGTYYGLVQDKVNNLQVKPNGQSANKPAIQQIKTKAGFSVKEIRQNFECRDSGYDSGYDSDTKVEQQLELGSKSPKSEIGSVSIEHGVIGGCRYKITTLTM